jgi:hypothetical protein
LGDVQRPRRCLGRLGDGAEALNLDGNCEEDSDGAPVEKIVRGLIAVHLPDSVAAQISRTALGGMQDADSPGYEPRWRPRR